MNSIIGVFGDLGGHIDRNNGFYDEVGPKDVKHFKWIHHENHKGIAEHEYLILESR